MSNKKYVCVVTWIGTINYGTCLQSFALNKVLSNMGYNPFMFSNYKFCYGIKHPIFTAKRLISKLMTNNKSTSNDLDGFGERIASNLEFQYSKIEMIDPTNRALYKEYYQNTICFISGSDQIWNPEHLSEIFLLFFCDKTKKRIAYSSSFGTNYIPKNKRRLYSKNLKHFRRIGVREKTGLSLLETTLKYKGISDVVLDPVMLLTKEEWTSIERVPHLNKELAEQKFVFCYFVGKRKDYDSDIELFLKKTNNKAIIATSESFVEHNYGENLSYLDVCEFIWLLNHSEVILTDSFHLTALAIMFKKPFIVFKRFNEYDKRSQNSRIVDLLESFDISDRIYDSFSDFENALKPLDNTKIDNLLKNKVDKSLMFLKGGIDDD